MRKLGLGDGNKIVVYDTSPMTGACRVWWMFRAMGHKDVAVLDGGLPKWEAEGRPVTDDPTTPRDRHFTARLDNTLVRSIDDVRALLESKREQVVDARAAGRFRGETPEPRAGLRSGHMPGSFNVPSSALVENGTALPREKFYIPGSLLEARLRPLAAPGGAWRALAKEQLALLALRQDKPDEAKAALKALAEDSTAPAGVRGRCRALLDRLGA